MTKHHIILTLTLLCLSSTGCANHENKDTQPTTNTPTHTEVTVKTPTKTFAELINEELSQISDYKHSGAYKAEQKEQWAIWKNLSKSLQKKYNNKAQNKKVKALIQEIEKHEALEVKVWDKLFNLKETPENLNLLQEDAFLKEIQRHQQKQTLLLKSLEKSI